MKTVKKSEDGKVMMTERLDGYAVAIWAIKWNATARMYLGAWETIAKGLNRRAADDLFAQV